MYAMSASTGIRLAVPVLLLLGWLGGTCALAGDGAAQGSAPCACPATKPLPAPVVRDASAWTTPRSFEATSPRAARPVVSPPTPTEPVVLRAVGLRDVTRAAWPKPIDPPATLLVRTAAQADACPAPPPPPPPPAPTSEPCAPVWSSPVAPVAAPAPLAGPCWSGCGLPCEEGISMWHVRGVAGRAFYAGCDAPDDCGYFGADVGRSFCGCWGLDAFYRWSSGRFHRILDPRASRDGGYLHHVGLKFTMEHSFSKSHFYWWVGVGPEYFWTADYLDNDHGFGVFGEAGVGYVLNQTLRIRVGLNAHGDSTDVTRRDPADDGSSRWLWTLAPVAELEVDF
jgi:hypothetical protein